MKALLHLTRLAQSLARRVERRRAAAQALAALLALGLGFWGWQVHAPPTNVAGWLNNLFRTLQLVTLQFPSLDVSIPWQLQVARLAVPLVAALATFNVIVGAVTRPARLALLPFARDHLVMLGAGQVSPGALAVLARGGRQIVVAEASMSAARREALEGLGLTVAEAEPRAPATLAALNVKHAAAVLITGEDEVENLNLAVLALEAVRHRPADAPPLLLAVLLEGEELGRQLDAALDALSRGAGVRYRRLSTELEGLEAELVTISLTLVRPQPGHRSHVLLIGLEGRWQAVLHRLIRAGQDHATELPLVTLMLNASEAQTFAAWHGGIQELALVARFRVLHCAGLLTEDGDRADWLREEGQPDLAVVLRPDAAALATALALRQPGAPGEGIPILVRQSREDLVLGRLGEAVIADRDLRRIRPFGGLLRPEGLERVLDHRGEGLAMALHAAYLARGAERPPGSAAVAAAWDELRENHRAANRASAAHAPILAAAEPGFDPAAPDREALERLARIEHRRWIAERIAQGWRRSEHRDDARFLHPSLVPYDALSEEEREKDRAQVVTVLRLWREGHAA